MMTSRRLSLVLCRDPASMIQFTFTTCGLRFMFAISSLLVLKLCDFSRLLVQGDYDLMAPYLRKEH